MADRRSFLRGLASLPLIGGSVAILGKPTAAAVPATPELMEGYKAWLCWEHSMLCHEMVDYDVERAKQMHRVFHSIHPGFDWHFQFPNSNRRLAGWPEAPQPSSRAAIVLSAVGCPLDDGPGGPFYR